MSETSFKTWLLAEIRQSLGAKSANRFIFWCDPERVWKPLLERIAEGADFELWAEEKHELLLRDRLHKAPPMQRVIWLPCEREEIGYLRVFELRAADVKTWSLPEALARYGVELSSEQLAELRPLLAAHTQEWLERPRAAWKELTPGSAKGALMDDDRMLELIATPGMSFAPLVREERFSLFVRRAKDDFGLPEPTLDQPDGWRVQAVASLLCSDAAAKCPDHPPGEQARIIPPGAQRERALRLLGRWQKQVDLLSSFEQLAPKADAVTSLQFWARNLERLPAQPFASSAVERAIFEQEVTKVGLYRGVRRTGQNIRDAIDCVSGARWRILGKPRHVAHALGSARSSGGGGRSARSARRRRETVEKDGGGCSMVHEVRLGGRSSIRETVCRRLETSGRPCGCIGEVATRVSAASRHDEWRIFRNAREGRHGVAKPILCRRHASARCRAGFRKGTDGCTGARRLPI